MAIPTLPSYSGWVFTKALEHPDCYVGMYRNDGDTQNRVATFNKDTLAEFDTYDYSEGDIAYAIISAYDDVLWIPHYSNGDLYSFDITSGTITLLASNDTGTTWAVHDNGTHVWCARQTIDIRIYEKTSKGVLNVSTNHITKSEAGNYFHRLVAIGDTDFIAVFLRDAATSGASTINTIIIYNKFSFVEKDRKVFDYSGSGSVAYTNNTNDFITPVIKFLRSSEVRHVYINTNGKYEDYEFYDPSIKDSYDYLVAQKDVFAWYDFRESTGTAILDRSGNERDMTITGGYTREDSLIVDGIKSLNLTSSGEVITDADEVLNATPESCLEAWIKIDTYTTVNSAMPFGYYNTGSGVAYFAIIKNTGTLAFAKYDGDGDAFIHADTKLSLDKVYHIVMQQTTAGMEIWLNGVLLYSNTDTGNYDAASFDTFAMNIDNGSIDRMVYSVSNLVVYQDTLTEDEIRARYNLGSTKPLAGSYRERILSLSPLVYYPCDDGGIQLTDYSGNEYHATTINGNPTFDNSNGLVDGDNCIGFVDEISGGFRCDTSIPVTTIGTMELWINKTADQSGVVNDHELWTTLGVTTTNSWYAFYDQSTKTSGFKSRNEGGTITRNSFVYNDFVEYGEWCHIVITVDSGLDIQKLYINGVLVSEDQAEGLDANPHVLVGNYLTGFYDYNPHGFIQHVAIYDYRLTDSQVLDNYLLGSNKSIVAKNGYEQLIIDSDPIFYFPLDETTGTTVEDRMGRVIGTLNGGSADTMTSSGLLTSYPTQPCLDFNGTDQTILVKGGQGLGKFTGFTMEAIVSTDVVDSARHDVIGTAESGGYVLDIHTTNFLNAHIYTDASGTFDNVDGPTAVVGRTYHLAATFDGRYHRIYVDGVFYDEFDTGSQTYIDYSTHLEFLIGAQWDGISTYSNFWNGKIAHLAVYDKALTEEVILDHAECLHQQNKSLLYTEIVGDAPTIFYPMQDNLDKALDVIGGDSGTFTGSMNPNTAPLTEDVNDKSYTFDSSYVSLSNEFITALTNNSDFSVEMMMIQDGAPNELKILAGTNNGGSNYGFLFGIIDSGVLRLSVFDNTAATKFQLTTEDVSDNIPHHVAFTFTNGIGYKVYIDGRHVGTDASWTSSHLGDIDTFTLGSEFDSGPTAGNYFEGRMSHFAFYDVALTDEQVSCHAAASKGHAQNSYEHLVLKSMPRARWKLNDQDFTLDEEFGDGNYTTNDIAFDGPPLHSESERSIEFLGNDVDTGGSSLGAVSGLTKWTLSTWIQLDGGKEGYLYSETGSGTRYVYAKIETDNTVRVNFNDGTNWADAVNSVEALPIKTPMHLAWVRDGITSTIYVNGKVFYTGSHGATTGNNAVGTTDSSSIGNTEQSPYLQFDGYLDDFIVFQSALTEDEISDQYHAVKNPEPTAGDIIESNSPVFYLRCNQLAGPLKVRDDYGLFGTLNDDVRIVADGKRNSVLYIANDAYISFDAQDYLTIPATTGEFTAMVWVKFNGDTSASQRVLDFRGTGAVGSGVPGIQINTGNSAPFDDLNGSVIEDSSGNYARFDSTSYGLFDDQWHHIAITWNAANQDFLLYVDGAYRQRGTVTGTVGEVSPVHPLYFGRSSDDATTQDFEGWLDDVIMFTKTLTSSNIRSIYQRQSSRFTVDGFVTEDDIPVKRKVRVYDRISGELVYATESNLGGDFEMVFDEYSPNQYYVIALDDDSGNILEAIVKDRISADTPEYLNTEPLVNQSANVDLDNADIYDTTGGTSSVNTGTGVVLLDIVTGGATTGDNVFVPFTLPSNVAEFYVEFDRTRSGTWFDDDGTDGQANFQCFFDTTTAQVSRDTVTWRYARPYSTETDSMYVHMRQSATSAAIGTRGTTDATASGSETGTDRYHNNWTANTTKTIRVRYIKMPEGGYQMLVYEDGTLLVERYEKNFVWSNTGVFGWHHHNYNNSSTEQYENISLVYTTE